MVETVIVPLIMIVIVIVAVLTAVIYMVLLERKVQAWVQVRYGPMRVGYRGLLQTIADTLKLFLKEDITPAKADKWVFTVAPILVLVPSLIAFAVIPLSRDLTLFGLRFPGQIADVNVGLLYIVSVASIGVYGIILGGWSSNSKFPLLGSLRSSAQLISYEVAVTMTLVTVIMLSGTLSLAGIVKAQLAQGWWFGFMQPVAFFIYVVGGLAETNRAPFDLPEAEQELVGGFHTEYSGMRFAFFFLAEYTNMMVISSVATTLFMGGWLQPFPNVSWLGFLGYIPGWVWFLLKTFGFLYVFLWVRATFPRYRYDQLMRLGWKWLIPLAILNLVVTGLVKVLV
jgi:NADH-quinone oxidoreductase subunit H